MPSAPASLSAFENQILDSIITGSLVLSVISLVFACFIIAKRAWRQRQELQGERKRHEISALVHHLLSARQTPLDKDRPPFSRKDLPLVFDTALSIMRTIKGADAAYLVTMLNSWGVRSHARTRLRAGARAEKIRALAYLARCKGRQSLEDILQASADEDRYVQLAALRALAERQEARYLGLILRHMEAAGQRNTLLLTEILTRFGQDAVPDLVEMMQKGTVLEMRVAGANALGAIGASGAVEVLASLAAAPDTHPELKAKTLQALGRIGDPRAEGAVIENLSSPEKAVRVQAARAAGALGLAAALPQLAALLGDTDWWVRFRAAEALTRLGRRGQAVLEMRQDEAEAPGADIARLVLIEKGM